MSQKNKQLNVALVDADFAALEAIRIQHGIPPTEFTRKLVHTAVEFYRKNGWFSFPAQVQPVATARPTSGFSKPPRAAKTRPAISD